MNGDDHPTRTVVVHCPQWPVVAASGISTSAGGGNDGPDPDPMVVVKANRVVAASVGARRAGVEVGMRRREAQRRCPHVVVSAHDPERDAESERRRHARRGPDHHPVGRRA